MIEQKITIKDIDINYKHFGGGSHTPYPSPAYAKATAGRQEGKKEVFLILHGWGGSSDSWLKVCELLENDYEIYALDFPFFGKSRGLNKSWKVDDYVGLVEEFINKVIHTPCPPQQNAGQASQEGSFHIFSVNIIAHSFGGRVAIKMAAKNPPYLKKLFLCDAAGIKHPPTLKQKIVGLVAKTGKKIKLLFARDTTSRVILTLSARKGKDPIAYSLKPCSYLAPRDSSPRPPACADRSAQNDAKILKFLYRILGASDYYNCKNEIMRETFKNIIAEDLTPYLSEIKKPAIIIWGEKDKYTPLADGILMNKKIKNSKLHIIKNAGHGIHIYESGKLAEIILKGK